MPENGKVVIDGADSHVDGENQNPVVNEDALTASGESETPPVEDTGTAEKTAGKTEPSESEKVIIKIREDERAKTKAAREEARLAKEEAARALRIAEEAVARREPQVKQEEYDPDEPMTRGEWEKLEREKKAKEAQKELEDKVSKSVQRAKEKYKNSEFNYDKAIEYAAKNFSQNRFLAIFQSEDPAEELYNLVLIQPDIKTQYLESVQKEAVKETVATLNKHLNQTGTLTKAGSSSTIDEVKKWDQMSYKDILKEQEKVIASR